MAARPLGGLQSHLGYWLRTVSNHVSNGFRAKVEACGVTVAEWVILRSLFDHQDGLNPSKLAAELGVMRGTVSKLVDRLSHKNLVEVGKGIGDRRFQTVRLTSAGRGLVPTLARLADDNERETFGELTAQQRQQLLALLQRIAQQRGLRAAPIE